MKKLFFLIPAIVAVLSVSCSRTDELLYRTLMSGNVLPDGSLRGDDGNTYVFSNMDSKEEFFSVGRVVALFDVMKLLDEASSRYSARMIEYVLPLCKEPSLCTSVQDAEALGADPVLVENSWYSGGYLNLKNSIMVFDDPEAQHVISLAAVPAASASDTLRLMLRHDCGVPYPSEDQVIMSKYIFYASFPIEELLPESGKVIAELSWYWDGKLNTEYTTLSR